MKIIVSGIILLVTIAIILISGCVTQESDSTEVILTDLSTQPQVQEESDDQSSSFSEQAIDYFKEIALTAEYEDNPEMVRKWVKNPIIINVHGNPNEESMNCLESVITDFNSISTTIKLRIDQESQADIDIYFVPYSQFTTIEPNYVGENWGFFGGWINSDCEIYKAEILISTDKPTSREQCHLIREELTQSLGLAMDSNKYPDSIFYIEWSDTNEYSEMDKDLIRMLYSTDIAPGTTSEGVCSYFGCS